MDLQHGFERRPDHDQDLDGTLRPAPARRAGVARLPAPPSEFDLIGTFARNLGLATLLGVIPGGLAFLAAFVAWVSSAVPALRDARADTVGAEAAYHAALRDGGRTIGELGSLGAPQGELETVYFAFADAPAGERRHAADVLLGVLVDQTRVVDAATQVGPMLAPAVRARAEASAAYLRWATLSDSPRGRAAALLGLADAPPAALQLYAKRVRD